LELALLAEGSEIKIPEGSVLTSFARGSEPDSNVTGNVSARVKLGWARPLKKHNSESKKGSDEKPAQKKQGCIVS
jgi:hypothetical protein